MNEFRYRNLVSVFCLLLVAALAPCIAVGEENNHVQAQLIADVERVAPGSSFRLGVLFTIEADAHIYWRHPGSSGLATGIDFTLPEGAQVEELQWPNPHRFEFAEIDDISYGYEGEALLFANVTAPSGLKQGETFSITANAYWLVCLESGQCIPEAADLRIDLPVGSAVPSEQLPLFERFAKEVPRRLDPSGPVSAEIGDGIVTLNAKRPWRFSVDVEGDRADLFPSEGEAWTLDRSDDASELRFRLGEADSDAPPWPGAALTLPLVNVESNKRRTLYVLMGK